MHANSPEDALRRLETLALMAGVGLPNQAVRDQLAGTIDLMVHQACRPDGSRNHLHARIVHGLIVAGGGEHAAPRP